MQFVNLKKCIDKIVSDYNTPSGDVAVYQNHKLLFRYFTGMSDIENNKQISGNELYIIFSMTKMLTCACALQLLEQGKYTLDDKLSKYLPEYEKMKITTSELNAQDAVKIASGNSVGSKAVSLGNGFAKTPITIRHLFTMTAGLDYAIYCDEIQSKIKQGKKTTRELVAAMADKPLGFEPGTRFNYSLCHDVLGALIEVWSGQKFGDYMSENLLKPLGMNDTFFGLPKDAERLSRMAASYRFDQNHIPQRIDLFCGYNLTDEYQSGGAGLISTTQDYALFLDAIACGGVSADGKRILKEDTINLWKTNALSGKAAEDFDLLRAGYGYGLGVRTHINPARSGSLSPVGEFGWDGAAGGLAMVDSENKISLTYMQQAQNWDGAIHKEIRNALYKDLGL